MMAIGIAIYVFVGVCFWLATEDMMYAWFDLRRIAAGDPVSKKPWHIRMWRRIVDRERRAKEQTK